VDFISNLDLGSYIVLTNSDKVSFTGNKLEKKKYYNHSGYPGGLRERSTKVMLQDYSRELIFRIIKGMMPHNKLSDKQLKRLFIYTGDNHPFKNKQLINLENNE
jgi:large subunit ribosomal protein L13